MDEFTTFIIALLCAVLFFIAISWPAIKTQVRLWQLNRRAQEAHTILRRNNS